jgi:hypothetical protein
MKSNPFLLSILLLLGLSVVPLVAHDSQKAAFEVDVADGARTRESLFQLNLVFTIAPKITEAIKLFSGNVATTDYGAGINMLNELRLSLGDAAEQGNQDAAIDAAISDGGLVLNGKERERVSS